MKTKRNRRVLGFGGALMIMVGGLIIGSRARGTAVPAAPAPPDVEVAIVQQRDLPIEREWVGTLDGMVNAEIKAQVSGYLLRTDYTEGSFVNRGALLFEIDPRPFQAAVDQARGEVAKAQGQLAQANSQLSQAKAQVVQAEANQRKTQLQTS